MKRLDKLLNEITTSYLAIAFIGFMAFLAALIIPWLIPNENLGTALKDLAQINITVAIGLGTLVIAFKAKPKIVSLWTRRILVLLALSSLSFSLSFVESPFVQTMYMTISGMLLVSIILAATHYLQEHVDK